METNNSTTTNQPRNISQLRFDNQVLLKLPLDPVRENYVRPVPNACFSRVMTVPIDDPEVVAVSWDAMGLLDLTEKTISNQEIALYFSGNAIMDGSDPAAHCYCGYQFGVFAGQLGDGRAIYLGEIINSKGERWELQLKGAGKTPFSRQADGRAVLRSSIREFLCSEAMYYLGVPTTRAGTCVTSSTRVMRDLKYDGHPRAEKCTVVLRIAPSFFRFGSFEVSLPTSKESGRSGPSNSFDVVLKLLNFTIKQYYPHLVPKPEVLESDSTSEKQSIYLDWYKEVVTKTAILVAEWQCIGFAHGVLNTDNMSIMGLTIDYGPFGFLDAYDPEFICNGSDHDGRYAFGKQPEICQWNCEKLAEAISPVLPLDKTIPIVKDFQKIFSEHFLTKMRKKLGLFTIQENDHELVHQLLDIMEKTGADMTNTFRSLSQLEFNNQESVSSLIEYILSQCLSLEELAEKIQPEVSTQELEKYATIAQKNPYLLMFYTGHSPQWLVKQFQLKKAHDALMTTSPDDKRKKDR